MVDHRQSERDRFVREALPQLGALRQFAFRLCRDVHSSQDLVQETMLKACAHFESYREGTNCRAWLFQICKHSYLNTRRRRQYEPVAVDFQSVAGGADAAEAGEEQRAAFTPGDHAADLPVGAGLGDRVYGALRSLPDGYRTVVILSDLEGLSYREIADLLRAPLGTVRSRIHRGRGKLRARLAEVPERRPRAA